LGNTVAVPVIKAVAERILDTIGLEYFFEQSEEMAEAIY
jgi:hypothetical protein